MKTTITTLIIIFLVIQLSLAGEKLKTLIPVKGMRCRSCARMIEKTVLKVTGIEHVTVNVDLGTVAVEYDSTRSLSDAIKAITRMGYKVVNADSLAKTEKNINH